MGYALRVARYEVRVTSYELRITRKKSIEHTEELGSRNAEGLLKKK